MSCVSRGVTPAILRVLSSKGIRKFEIACDFHMHIADSRKRRIAFPCTSHQPAAVAPFLDPLKSVSHGFADEAKALTDRKLDRQTERRNDEDREVNRLGRGGHD